MIKKKNYILKSLKPLLNEIEKRRDEGILDKSTPKTIERLSKDLEKCLKKIINKNNTLFTSKVTSRLKKKYSSYLKQDYLKNNRGLKGWRLNILRKPLRKELEDRIIQALGLIKNNNASYLDRLKNRFLNWGAKPSGSLLEALKVSKENKKIIKHNNMVLADQTAKMISNFDDIVANHYKAIAFIWETRDDNRVVGNPKGKNPIVTNPKMHGDHYARNQKIYFLHNTWAIKEKLINIKHRDFEWADFEDGMPGQPINCRCYASYLYQLQDLPAKLLTEKGKKML